MRVFVTVGSTKFDRLVRLVLHESTLDVLREKGYTAVIIQCGSMHFEDFPASPFQSRGCNIEIYRFKPSLEQDYDSADLVISHAGSGTILDVLRKPKPLIAVANTTLLDNHQKELSDALSALGHIKTVKDVMTEQASDELAQAIRDARSGGFTPFPSFDGSRFQSILDAEMGYVA